MFTQPKKREHLPEEAVLPQFTPEEIAAEMTEFMERLGRIYSHKKIVEFIMSKLDGKSSLTTCEIEVDGTEDFVKLLMAVVKSGEKELPYRVEFKDGYLYVNGYRLPELVLARETGAGYVGK